MTIAEKLVDIAERVPMVFEAGQMSMVDYSKIIPKTVSGSVISLDDVSEIPHDVAVQLSSDTVTNFNGVKVTVQNGKNLFNPEVLLNYGGVFQEDGSIFFKTTNVMSDVVVYQNDGNTQRFSLSYLVRCVDNTASSGVRFKAFYTDGSYNYIGNVKPLDYEMVTWVSDSGKVLDCIKGDYGSTLNSTWLKDIQLEIGASPTEYEKYTAYDYIAESNGKIIAKSSSPYMKITTDTLGINLTATYHKSWGMQTEYDRFWDAFQKNGTALVNGTYMFSGHGWTDNIYAPKYPIKLNVGTGLFAYSDITDTKVEIDFTNTSGSDTHVFYWAQYCTNIRKLKVSENTTYSNWFNYCSYLEEVRFEGTIGKSLDIHWSTKLSFESIDNITAHLSESSNIAEFTLTLPTTAKAVYESHYGESIWTFIKTLKPKCAIAFL